MVSPRLRCIKPESDQMRTKARPNLIMHQANRGKTMTLSELVEKHGESIDNLPMDILMEAIYNERYASVAGVLHQHESKDTQET